MTDVLPDYIDKRSITAAEERWLPLRGREHRLEVLNQELRNRSIGWQVRAGVKEWLTLKARGESDPSDSHTRSRYRRLLASLDVDPDAPDDGQGAAPKGRPPSGGPPIMVPVDEGERALKVLREAGIAAELGGVAKGDVYIIGGRDLPEAA